MLLFSFAAVLVNIFPVHATANTLASSELINAYSISTSQISTWLDLLEAQNITRFIFRLNAMYDWNDDPPTMTGINKAKTVITAANARGINVSIDLHTWYTTWDTYFRDGVSNYVANRETYISYVEDTLTSFEGSNVYSFMVMNEPQGRTATSGENQFILDIITAAHASTTKPISIRFMCGYSPSTGHYSAAIDTASDYLCRNSFWDPQDPSTSVYGTTQAKILTAISTAHNAGKEFWMTETGYHKPQGTTWNPTYLEYQRSFAEAILDWSKEHDVDFMSLWVCYPTSSNQDENYNLFSPGSWTPHSAFYELTNQEEEAPPDTPPNVVQLNEPNNLETVDSLTVLFNYTPTFYQPIQNSSLWANETGTWQRLAWNNTAITNATMHTISYAFSVEAVYVWNVQVFNSTHAHWATANRTLTITLTPPPDDPPTYSDSSISVSTKIISRTAYYTCVWDDDVSLHFGIFSHNASGTWQNKTAIPIFAPHLTLEDSFTLPSTVGTVVGCRSYANDTAGQWNSTEIYAFTTLFLSFSAPSADAIVYGSNFQLSNITTAIGCRSDLNKTLFLIVDGGSIDGVCNVAIYRDRGILQYAASYDTNLTLNHDSEFGYDLSVSGATKYETATNFIFMVNVTAGNIVTISWHWKPDSYIDRYTLLGMGLIGIAMMVVSPSWVAYKIKNDGIDEDTVERFAYAFLIFLVGFGLMIVWLWH